MRLWPKYVGAKENGCNGISIESKPIINLGFFLIYFPTSGIAGRDPFDGKSFWERRIKKFPLLRACANVPTD